MIDVPSPRGCSNEAARRSGSLPCWVATLPLTHALTSRLHVWILQAVFVTAGEPVLRFTAPASVVR